MCTVQRRSPSLPFDPVAEARRQWRDHGWTEAADGMAVITSIMRVQQIYLARVEAVLRPLGLTFARYEVLMLLDFSRAGALPLGVVGSRLQVHPASVTNAVNRLEDDGLVRRRPHDRDGRTTLAEVTATGRSLARRATNQLNVEVFGRPGLSPGELRRVFRLLQGLRHRAGDFEEKPSGLEEEAG